MIRTILDVYIYIIIADAVLSYIPSLRQQSFAQFIKKAADYTQAPIRKYLPRDLPVDVSPLVVIVVIKLIKTIW